MNRRKLGIRIGILIFFIFLINLLAGKFYWYSLLWWFDMPMHFLGGIFVGLAVMYFLSPKDFNFKSVLKTMLCVLAVAVAWEVFEVLVDKNISRNGFDTMDTLSDIFFGLAGGMTAVLYFHNRIMSNSENNV